MLSSYLRQRHGERVQKVSLHCGFTCPNRDGTLGTEGCTFCDGRALEPAGYRDGRSVAEQLEHGIAYVARRYGVRRFIAYFQDYSATYGPVDRLEALYCSALGRPEVVGMAISTRPDCLQPDALDLLERIAGQTDVWLEVGLQIADDRLLESLRRGHSVACFVEAVEALHRRRLKVCAHVIVGLPGATREAERRTGRLLASLGVWGVKVHAFHVLHDTEMARRYLSGGLELPNNRTMPSVRRTSLPWSLRRHSA